MIDRYGRTIDYVRISVTDRCNFRCKYCLPAEGVQSLEHQDILTYEETVTIVKALAGLGIRKVKITGGEPLIRKGLLHLITSIHSVEGIEDVTLTTNGYLLENMAEDLKAAGISTVNVSIDTLNPEHYTEICRVDGLSKALRGIDAAILAGMKVRINCTVSEESREDEILELVRYGVEKGITVRFIEMMPIGIGRIAGIGNDDICTLLKNVYPDMHRNGRTGNGPAVYYDLHQGKQGEVGMISAVHHKFCDSCNRIRLTADGCIKPCLASDEALNIKDMIRNGCGERELSAAIEQVIYNKPVSHHFDKNQVGEQRTMNRIGG